MEGIDPESVSGLLEQINHGDAEAKSRLIDLVYVELRRLAARFMAGERPDHTLQPTALVNEAYLRLVGQSTAWQGRAHFFAVAAQVMRHVLVDHARTRNAERRGGNQQQITLDDALASSEEHSVDLIALDEALTRLAALDLRQSHIVEMRYFAGLTVDEIAEVLHLSEKTVTREWQSARLWLRGQLVGNQHRVAAK